MATDKFSANVNTKGKIAQGHSVSSKIDFAGDQDWFKVSLKRGQTYEFTLEGAGTGQGTLPDVNLTLYNASGIVAPFQSGSGGIGSVNGVFQSSVNGNYFIDASGGGSSTGSYRLKVTRLDIAGDQEGVSDGTDTEGKIAVGQTKQGHLLFPGDDDWYAVNLKANTSYVFNAHTLLADNAKFLLILRDAQGNYLDGLIGDPETTLGYTTGNSGGKFFLEVSSADTTTAYYSLSAGFGTPV